MANINTHDSIQQLHDVIFDIEQSVEKGQNKYIQIKQGAIVSTSNSKEKASYEQIAKLITSLKEAAFQNKTDLKIFAESLEHFRNIEPLQHDTGFFSLFHLFPSQAEKSLEDMHPELLEVESLRQKSNVSDEDLYDFLMNSKLRSVSLSYIDEDHKNVVKLAVQKGLTKSQGLAILIYSSDAYKTLNAYLRKQEDVFKELVNKNQRILPKLLIHEFDSKSNIGKRGVPIHADEKRVIEYYKNESHIIAETVNSGYEKLPKYQGKIFRGDLLSDEELKRMNTGEYFDEAFLSFSTDETISKAFSLRDPTNPYEKHHVLLEVESKTGRLTSELSKSPEEKEVTYMKGQRFKVIKKEEINVEIDYGERRERKVLKITLAEI